jgi:high-affinity iron transporter
MSLLLMTMHALPVPPRSPNATPLHVAVPLTAAAQVRPVACVSVLLSAGAAYLFARASNQALWEGVLAMTAAVLVATLIVHMWRHARRMRHEIEAHLEAAAVRARGKAFLGVFVFTLLMITREGMETALLMGTLFSQLGLSAIAMGAVLGTLAAATVAWLWSRYGHRVNLAIFFQVTAVFLAVFVLQLFIYGFHELTEANLWVGSPALHEATEPYGPDGVYGHYLSYMLLALPLGWLAFAALFGGGKKAPGAAARPQLHHHAATR